MVSLKVGDKVMRYISSERIPMGPMTVTEIDEELIHCGPWTFDRELGFEVDPDLGWGKQPDGKIITGSVIERCEDGV